MPEYTLLTELAKTDGLIIPLYEDVPLKEQVGGFPGAYAQVMSKVIDAGDFLGKRGESSLVYAEDRTHARTVLCGMGRSADMTLRLWKQTIGAAVIQLQQKKTKRLSVIIPESAVDLFGAEKLAQETVIAADVSNYCFDDHREAAQRVLPVAHIDIIYQASQSEKKVWAKGIAAGKHIATATNITRHLGNTPPSHMTPSIFAKEAQKLHQAYETLKVTVLGKKEIAKLGMGCLLAVASGSQEEPKFIIVEYRGGKKTDAPTVLVGKGITFDSGGLSIKPWDYMVDMKYDMLGGATVLGVMQAVAALKIKKNIIALVPTCENMPSGTAYRPDDILTAMNGKTVLVENTDAEGRLILADALCYAAKYKPKEVIDFATLTGACVVALGNERSGLFTQDEGLADGLDDAARAVGEQLWRLPLGEEYSEAVKSEVADVKNTGGVGGARYAGASTAAAFLGYFTDYPWAHIDLSSSHYGGKGKPYIRGGANGFGVQTMVEYLKK